MKSIDFIPLQCISNNYKSSTVAVIGAGPAGITAAYQISKAGLKVDVFEASESVGGLAKTITLWNQKVDIGPHRFFSNDTRVNRIWLEVANGDYHMVNRLTRIYYRNKFYYYPLKPLEALSKLGASNAVLSMISYLWEFLNPTKLDGSFETWVKHRFGSRLYAIFFKSYTEKLWGIPCANLDGDFAAQRIKKLSLGEAVINAFKKGKANKHRTLIDQFAYPIMGTGMIYKRMQQYIEDHGGQVHLNSPVRHILTRKNDAYAIEFVDGTIREFDEIISSMPLTDMVSRLPDVPTAIKSYACSLIYRNTIIVYLKIEAINLFPDNWLYIHSPELQMGRITNFRNWVSEINCDEKNTIVAIEYWCYSEDLLWNTKDTELINLGKNELYKTGLIGNTSITDGFVLKIPKCYPVYTIGYKNKLKPVKDYLATIQHLNVIGRYGAFKYNNQDHSILMGIMAAENVISGKKNNLWEINTDYDVYQEKSVIIKNGLSSY